MSFIESVTHSVRSAWMALPVHLLGLDALSSALFAHGAGANTYIANNTAGFAVWWALPPMLTCVGSWIVISVVLEAPRSSVTDPTPS